MRQGQVPKCSSYGPTRSGRGIFSWIVRGHQPVCNTCQASYHHAERYSAGQKDPRRESLNCRNKKITVLSGPPIPPKGDNLKNYPLNVKACKRKGLPVKIREIKLFPIGHALSKQIPLKVNGFAETRSFPHLLR